MTSPDERFDDAFLDGNRSLDQFLTMAETWGVYADTRFAWRPVLCIKCRAHLYTSLDSTGTIVSYTDEEVLVIVAGHIQLDHKEVQ